MSTTAERNSSMRLGGLYERLVGEQAPEQAIQLTVLEQQRAVQLVLRVAQELVEVLLLDMRRRAGVHIPVHAKLPAKLPELVAVVLLQRLSDGADPMT